jgi:predicted nuclease of predicted toxin-antitoxin system
VKFLLDHDVPDDIAFLLEALGHQVCRLRALLPITTPDDEVLRCAGERDCLLITCNRDDFITAARSHRHRGVIVLIRRKSRAAERAALVRLLDAAGESGLRGNINFA